MSPFRTSTISFNSRPHDRGSAFRPGKGAQLPIAMNTLTSSDQSTCPDKVGQLRPVAVKRVDR